MGPVLQARMPRHRSVLLNVNAQMASLTAEIEVYSLFLITFQVTWQKCELKPSSWLELLQSWKGAEAVYFQACDWPLAKNSVFLLVNAAAWSSLLIFDTVTENQIYTHFTFHQILKCPWSFISYGRIYHI